MNALKLRRPNDRWRSRQHFLLGDFYAVVEEVYDFQGQQKEVVFQVNKVFGWNGRFQDYCFCLYRAYQHPKQLFQIGVWDDKTLIIYEKLMDRYLRYRFEFIGGHSSCSQGSLYTLSVEALKERAWQPIIIWTPLHRIHLATADSNPSGKIFRNVYPV